MIYKNKPVKDARKPEFSGIFLLSSKIPTRIPPEKSNPTGILGFRITFVSLPAEMAL